MGGRADLYLYEKSGVTKRSFGFLRGITGRNMKKQAVVKNGLIEQKSATHGRALAGNAAWFS
jgi:hypothetical protein